uniref:Omega-lycotoxin-Am1b n=1 Tax=Alopecosa marikovskyi TaxID=2066572 RepID=TLCOB_ALOMR|nr:RecName: Full=Omega-lycotoxin-Am1b; Short=Omega-LCTX-Am1b; AltName: Full=Omega-Lsp-IA-like 1; AltName: Full=Omega-lycotoxin-Gsp(267)1b; Short=Omega-LCTX-Gsp(267)1b; Flags: Precursor [Alopecosa marikovskyi]ABP68826.1 omega-Lsp-IA-like 1 precursor [Alopecosa marikovskyi]
MKLSIFFVLFFIAIAYCQPEFLDDEEDEVEETLPVAEEGRERSCITWRNSCMHNDKGCCFPWSCVCWSQTVSRNSSRKEKKCQCRLW